MINLMDILVGYHILQGFVVGKILPSSSCLEFSTLAIKGHDILIEICKCILSLLPPLIPNMSFLDSSGSNLFDLAYQYMKIGIDS